MSVHAFTRTAVLAAAVFLAGCAQTVPPAASSADVALAVEPDAVSPGGDMTLLLRNGSGGTIGYNLCTSALERQSGGAWAPVPSDRVCTMELRTLEPGAEARYGLDVPADLTPGTYRFTTTVERMDRGVREGVFSDPFEVRT